MSVDVKFLSDPAAPTVNPNLYGHFAEHLGRCIYEGLWVGEESEIPNVRGIRTDVVEALRALNIPVLRWPGGCFADEYHWKDGIGPRAERPGIYNSHWGGVVETNHFGTHEFMDLCEQLECAPYICGNVGSGTVKEMQEWVEYVASDTNSPMPNLRRQNGRDAAWRLPYFGVGNESWGCGGNMRPEYYADLYRQYNTYVRTYGDNKIYRIACGANSTDVRWTEVMMEQAKGHMDGLSLHNYTLAGGKWPPSGLAAEFDEAGWIDILFHSLAMESLIGRHVEVMDRHDPERKVGLVLDEWGTWFAVEPGTNPGFLYQQNSLRDALVAALHFHIFHKFANRLVMANIAQTVNVLQAMVLTDGPRMLKTPTYWTFEMFKVHQGGQLVPVHFDSPKYEFGGVSIPAISVSATRSASLDISVVNTNPHKAIEVLLQVEGAVTAARVLTAETMTAHNTFDQPEAVRPQPFDGHRRTADGLLLEVPPRSVVVLQLD